VLFTHRVFGHGNLRNVLVTLLINLQRDVFPYGIKMLRTLPDAEPITVEMKTLNCLALDVVMILIANGWASLDMAHLLQS
jgi:hypothetical protein